VTSNVVLFRGMAIVAGLMRIGAKFTLVRSLYRRSAGTTRAAMARGLAVTKLYPSSSELALLSRKVHYKTDQAASVLGWSPSMRIEEGLRQSVAWCRMHGIV
jgi:nucleoside-diphosphate-sugar epimerase